MGEFRIGRRFAQHSYPDTPRAGGALAFARNSASGPLTSTPILAAGTQVPWATIENGAPAGVNVPIIPRVTGIIHITGVIQVASVDTVAATDLALVVQIGGVTQAIPLNEGNAIGAGAAQREAIPIDVIVGAGANGPALPLNVVSNVEIRVAATDGATVLLPQSSTLAIQEVPRAA